MVENSGRAFVIRPFNIKSNKDGETMNFEVVHNELIVPALDKLGFSGGTTGEFLQQGSIREDMFREIISADLVIADISVHNANAFYELGIRHALRDRYTVMIRADKFNDAHVFDLKPERYLNYSADNPADSVDALVKVIEATMDSEKGDSPVFRLLPGLLPMDPATIVGAPLKFREQVAMVSAKATENRAALDEMLQLKGDVYQQYWEREGLREIARAQTSLGDHKNAAITWEQLRRFEAHDLEANQKLATHYQKLEQYTESDQAAARCLQATGGTDLGKAETHALIGSNHKAQWRTAFRNNEDISQRQIAALTSDSLEKSFNAYHAGFEYHRSHYYSGLNAVSMLKIQLGLAEIHPQQWEFLFDRARKAEFELEDRQRLAHQLEVATELAIRSAIKHKDDDWARISLADLQLVSSQEPESVQIAYSRCKLAIKNFSGESLRQQLKLYTSLGLFEQNVNAALSAIDS